jgi:DNA-binding MarR family transcriptional regulator
MDYEHLKLKNQICHPLYSATNAIVRAYDPHLKKLDLTYPQYLVMMALWEKDKVSISKISEETFIDSGSMTPLLKRLADKKLISINACKDDRRQKVIGLTRKGEKLKDEALEILPELASCFTSITADEAMTLKKILNKLFIDLSSKEE